MSYDDWKARAPVYEEPPPICESCDGTLDEFGRCDRCEARFCPDCDGDPCQCRHAHAEGLVTWEYASNKGNNATEHLWSLTNEEDE